MTCFDCDDDGFLPPPCPDPCVGEALLVAAAGGVVNAALIAMLGSADAFAARLLAASGQAGQLYALQLRTLASDIDVVKPARAASVRDVDRVQVDRTVIDRSPPGAPVVT